MIRNVISLAVAALVLGSCSSKNNEASVSTETEKIPVKVMKLEKQKIARTLDYAANLSADEQVYYAPVFAGRISKINVEVGDRIRKGQVLVEMDKTDMLQSEIQLKNLEVEYNRAVRLNETGSISKQAYDAAVTNYKAAKVAYERLMENTKMEAPFNGVVTGKFFEEGELYTGAAAGGAAKPSIVSIEKINPLKAHVSISEQYFRAIKKGTEVEIHSDIYPERTFTGKVSIVYPTIDESTRTFTVEISVPNNDEALRPGMYGTINFFVGEDETVVVPSIAVLKVQGANNRYVFVNNNGVAKRVEVKLGKRFEDQVEIVSNEIKEGDELVVVGQGHLVDGALITVSK